MKMFISPSTETSWKAEPEQLAAALADHLSPIEFFGPERRSRAHSLEWAWMTSDGSVEGSLDAACTCVVLDGDIARCAEFAIWFRTFVPRHQELLFYDESYSADVALRGDTTEAELISPFTRET